MDKREGLSDFEKEKISAFGAAGLSHHEIAKCINRLHDVVRRFLRDQEGYGTHYRGRTEKKLNDRGMRSLFHEAATGERSETRTMKPGKKHRGSEHDSPVPWRRESVRVREEKKCLQWALIETREHAVEEAGASLDPRLYFPFGGERKMPKLTDDHKVNRLEWATAYVDYGSRWDAVVFSDEAFFYLDGPDGCLYYWHDVRHERDKFFSRQMGGGSWTIWAAMSGMGVSKIAFLEGKQNSNKYVDTLSEFLLPFAHLPYRTEFVFQQDNATIHTSTVTRGFLDEMEVTTMSWPACSPDLNPIENLWSWLVKRVYANGKQYGNVKELKVSIEREWNRIPHQLLLKLVGSMKSRCIGTIVA